MQEKIRKQDKPYKLMQTSCETTCKDEGKKLADQKFQGCVASRDLPRVDAGYSCMTGTYSKRLEISKKDAERIAPTTACRRCTTMTERRDLREAAISGFKKGYDNQLAEIKKDAIEKWVGKQKPRPCSIANKCLVEVTGNAKPPNNNYQFYFGCVDTQGYILENTSTPTIKKLMEGRGKLCRITNLRTGKSVELKQ